LGVVDRWKVGPVDVKAVFEGIDGGGLDDCVWEAVLKTDDPL
jgi:hypothetical protein